MDLIIADVAVVDLTWIVRAGDVISVVDFHGIANVEGTGTCEGFQSTVGRNEEHIANMKDCTGSDSIHF